MLKLVGWKAFVAAIRGRGDIGNVENLRHPAKELLIRYKQEGAAVNIDNPNWDFNKLTAALIRGPHASVFQHISFLYDEFLDMRKKGQWVILPFQEVKHLPGLRISPPGCVEQRGRRPRLICDYTFSDVNASTFDIDIPLEAM